MEYLMIVLSAAFGAAVGYLIGVRSKGIKVKKDLIDAAEYWKATSIKQGKQIEDFRDRLTYFTVGEIPYLGEGLAEEYDENQPLLGLLFPLEEVNIDL